MILISGASGFLGSHLIGHIEAQELVILDRGVNRQHENYLCYQREINAENSYSDVLTNVEVVIHCAAKVHAMDDLSHDPLSEYREVNTLGTMNLANQAFLAGVKRFIFISSVKVNGESTSGRDPFSTKDGRLPKDFYGQSKAEAEEQLLQLAKETGLEVVIIRPTLVYGPRVKANFSALMNIVSKGIPLPFSCINTNKRSLVSVDNLVDLIVTCIKHPNAANQVFLVSDDNDVSTSGMVREMAKALGKRDWQIPIPLWCFRLLGKILNKKPIVDRLTGSLQVDISHTKETLNWHPPQTLEEGFQKTANAFLQSKDKEQ